MVLKTRIDAQEGRQDLIITRNFEIPVDLVFRAYTEAEFFEQWMGTKVITLDARKNGSYRFETSNPAGIVVFRGSGVIHECIRDNKIIRTFEMEDTSFEPQMEFLQFTRLTDDTSRLTIHTIYKTPELRDAMLKLPFAQGLNMAHNKLESIFQNRPEN
ncbi:MAG: SRPBCC domain-containing protein [Flavitalea sp.]